MIHFIPLSCHANRTSRLLFYFLKPMHGLFSMQSSTVGASFWIEDLLIASNWRMDKECKDDALATWSNLIGNTQELGSFRQKALRAKQRRQTKLVHQWERLGWRQYLKREPEAWSRLGTKHSCTVEEGCNPKLGHKYGLANANHQKAASKDIRPRWAGRSSPLKTSFD